ncbi:hypothetical protein ACFQY8_06480 [Alloscardovia venturai]|uniref:Uncharacterized protein n=1 Tax=Alloscardovia venturai TaxID=1769421 RepID=A0ABW2Y572_9BIFI
MKNYSLGTVNVIYRPITQASTDTGTKPSSDADHSQNATTQGGKSVATKTTAHAKSSLAKTGIDVTRISVMITLAFASAVVVLQLRKRFAQ